MWEKLKKFTTSSAAQFLAKEDDFDPIHLWTDDEMMVSSLIVRGFLNETFSFKGNDLYCRRSFDIHFSFYIVSFQSVFVFVFGFCFDLSYPLYYISFIYKNYLKLTLFFVWW